MFRSDSYLAFVRKNTCCAPTCMAAAEQAHHFAKRSGGGGIALKPHDTFVVPLCVAHHLEVHRHGGLKMFNCDRFNTNAHFFEVALRLVTQYLERKAA